VRNDATCIGCVRELCACVVMVIRQGRLNQAPMHVMRAYSKDQWESRWHGVHSPVEFAKIDPILHVCEYSKIIEKTSVCAGAFIGV
jgi:hypothetical protein